MFMIFVFISQSLGGVFWILVIVGPYVSTKVKRNFPRGYGSHIMYFLGLMPLKGYPSAFVKDFIE